MSHMLGYLQAVIGVLIVAGALALALSGVDARTPVVKRVSLGGLVIWGGWWACLPCLARTHDSLPAIALGGLVAWVLLRHQRPLRDLIAGWWPWN